MKNLLKLEFRKLKRQKSFYICLTIMLAMVLISGVTYRILADHAAEIAEISGGETIPVSFSAFLLGFTSAGMFSMLTAIFVSIAVCDDYESQIVKNIYARGYSRNDHYFAKLIYILTATTIMFLVSAVFTAVIGGALFGFEDLTGKTFLLLACQYVVCMAGVAFSFAIAVAIKKLGATIAVNIIAPTFIPLLLELADTALKINDFKITDVWMSSFLTSLMNIDVATGRIIACVLGAAAYIAVFLFAGYAVNKKSEV